MAHPAVPMTMPIRDHCGQYVFKRPRAVRTL